MVQKKLQKDSNYNEYDIDGDGIVSDEELNTVKTIHEQEAAEEKADAQRRMAWISMMAMILHWHGRCSGCLYGYDGLYE